jgi:hypothetical protein
MKKQVYIFLTAIITVFAACKTVDIKGTLDAQQILETEAADPKLAERSFDDEILTVSGQILEYSKNAKGNIILKLGVDATSEPLRCTLKTSQTFDSPLRQNQTAKLKGYAFVKDGKTELVNCIVLEIK